jgi:hypothetical protein
MEREHSQTDWIDASRLTVVVGHFGSGKSEFSINLALALAARGHQFSLADLDVVDPYFRSRECRKLLERRGGRLIVSSQACMDADVPSLPPDIHALFDDKSRFGVMDIGGDPAGARVLAQYRKFLAEGDVRIWFVVNANRPLTDTAEKAWIYLRNIEAVLGARITGLVNNTHLCHMTSWEDIRAGATLAEKLSGLSGIPVICHTVPAELVGEDPGFSGTVFPIKLNLRKPWEKTP